MRLRALSPSFERILVVKLADLGDVLTATPALRALRRRFPMAHITALVTPHTSSLLEGNDAVDSTLLFPKARFDRPRELLRPRAGLGSLGDALMLTQRLRAGRFDAVVLLHHLTTPWGRAKYGALLAVTGAPVRAGLDNGAGRFLTDRAPDRGFGVRHEVEYWLDVVGTLGASLSRPLLEIHLRPEELVAAEERWRALGLPDHRVVLLHPGSGRFSVARRWAPSRFAEVGDGLAGDGMSVALVAGPGEESLAAEVQQSMHAAATTIVARGSPRELAALLGRASLFVGNDSGMMHCSAAMGVPVVGVFGLTNHRAWGPFPPDRHRVVRLDLPCSPCFYTGLALGTPAGCPPRTCLNELGADAVLAAARELLQRDRSIAGSTRD